VSKSYVARARSRRRRYGEEAPGMQCNHVPLKLSGLEQALSNQVAAVNDWTLQQLCDWVQTEHGIRVGVSTMWKTLARLGLSLKKSHSMPASKRAQM
jgi:transposase